MVYGIEILFVVYYEAMMSRNDFDVFIHTL
jgi:hypothetical protein